MVERIYNWFRGRTVLGTVLADAVLAVALALPLLPPSIILLGGTGKAPLVITLVIAHAAIAVRRVLPWTAFIVVSLAMAVLALAPAGAYEGILPSAIVFPVTLYSVCVYGRPWRRMGGSAGLPGVGSARVDAGGLAALGVGVAGSLMLTARVPGPFWDRALLFGMLVVVCLACWGFALLRNERARQAELVARSLVLQERNRIAREMHDVVAHSLTVIVTQAQGAELIAARSPERAVQALGTIAATGRQALAETRRVLSLLSAPEEPAPQGYVDGDLKALVAGAGLVAALEERGEAVTLGPSARHAVYRLVQEALTNTLRHAGPGAAAWVTLDWAPGSLTVSVRDNGRGVGPAGFTAGRGLTGMRERFEALGGSVIAGPLPDEGFGVKGVLPL